MPYTRTSLLAHALVGYEQRKTEIDEAIARIRATLDGKTASIATATPVARKRRRTMSSAARKRMSLLMKRRWVKTKKAGRRRLA